MIKGRDPGERCWEEGSGRCWWRGTQSGKILDWMCWIGV